MRQDNSRPDSALWRSLTLIAAAAMTACASGPTGTPDNEPTLASLKGREVALAPDPGVVTNEAQTIAAYRKFLEGTAPSAPQRREAMRRLGDLEMDLADSRAANDEPAAASGATPGAKNAGNAAAGGAKGAGNAAANGAKNAGNAVASGTKNAANAVAVGPDYRAAIARYQDFLKQHPKDAGNDRVLYQLARAHELGGELELALKTLDRLVAEYPQTAVMAEAQFRRGELLFTTREYAKAERAYSTVLAGTQGNPYRERALYMQGWSVFKQGRLEEALHSFFGVLDLKVAGRKDDAGSAGNGNDKGSDSGGEKRSGLEAIAGLSRADRELVEDTFRVASLSLANLQGAASIPPYINTDARRSYEFRVYEQLGELYTKQERIKDAADTFSLFARQQPLHAQAPQLQARVIDLYQRTGFANQALQAKKDYVVRYGVDSDFRRANPEGWARAQPLVKAHLTELARHHHALAQKSKSSADSQEAVRWYRSFIASFPKEPDTAQNNFLLAELLFEDARFAEAAAEYQKTAYDYPRHARSADAGYAALLSFAGHEKRAAATELPPLQRAGVESALRFAKEFKDDTRVGQVLTNAAEKLFALRDIERAETVAQQVLALKPEALPAQRRVAWTVLAHAAFERGAFADAERGYTQLLALTPERPSVPDASRNEVVERLAASVYKQGEQARAAGKARDAVAHFDRVAAVAPQSSVRANAQIDAAATLIGLKDWEGATKTLEDFRQRYPNHALAGDVSDKLALAYLERQQWAQAANEFERIAASRSDPKLARSALWQAAELHEKAGDKTPAQRAAAAKVYERYLAQFPQPLEPALEARYRLARIAKADGNSGREFALMKEIFQADQRGGDARTGRTKTLGAMGAIAMAEPALAEYRKVALVEPLARQLKAKKARMEEVLKAYAVASEYGVAEATTAATFHTAALYQDFGRALITSQRPKSLKKGAEIEQYTVMLEEQAYPFEEKAIELHEVNARRSVGGVYDQWVKASFKALGELRPVRYGKVEVSEGTIDAIR